ncbi:hypothetical protein IWQ57_004839 [Coemansia nantahalensis]|uniref:Uncharacterized protein n=1 Tax=Coemansia nantahalensis TaxID=2789366 RepID=A0ACC1JQK4_9FUNG|nr:hypothetical protein IWQ57_004839 [Coemansia nantahalensis]
MSATGASATRLMVLAAVAGAALAMDITDADKLPDDAPRYRWPDEPLGWALTTHLCLCLVGYLGLLPTAVVLEAAGHKWHVLVQLAGALVAFAGIVFGWIGGSVHNAYARFGWFMLGLLAVQTAANLALALGAVASGRRARGAYRAVGWVQLAATYVAMVLGVIRFLSLCSYTKMGQCVSHFVRGSGLFLGGLAILVLMRLLGAALVPLRRPLEAYICALMMAVGLVGAFTEHNFLQVPPADPARADTWTHKDLQHTMVGILWLAAGLLGVAMTWRSHPRSRNVVPAITFAATGVVMIIHQQDLAMSSRVHFLFGTAMVCYGACTLCEITLLAAGAVDDHSSPAPIQYATVLFLCASGLALMGANRDMVLLLINSGLDPATYAMFLLSCAFVAMLYCSILVDLYRALVPATAAAAKYRPVSIACRRVSGATLAPSEPPSPTSLSPAGYYA